MCEKLYRKDGRAYTETDPIHINCSVDDFCLSMKAEDKVFDKSGRALNSDDFLYAAMDADYGDDYYANADELKEIIVQQMKKGDYDPAVLNFRA